MSEKTRLIIKKVAELYSFGSEKKTVEEVSQLAYEKLLDKEQEWEKALDSYALEDIYQAINNFWRYKSDKTRPSVAQILSFLETEKEVKKETKNVEDKTHFFSIESEFIKRDKVLAKNTDYLLSDYGRAVRYILEDSLIELIGIHEFKKLKNDDNVKERTDKYNLAMKNGLFNNFDYILRKVNNKPIQVVEELDF